MSRRNHISRFARVLIACAVLVFCLTGVSLAAGSLAPASPYQRRAWLPAISAVKPTPPPPGCTPNAQEAAIAGYMRSDPAQQRASLRCDPILARVARARAQDMAQRGYFGHVNPDGYAANYLVQQAGYRLPTWYDQSPTGNNIEAIAAGYGTPAEAWQGWMASPNHRTQLLGLQSFFAEQTDYGVGYAYLPGSPYGSYWVVLTARH